VAGIRAPWLAGRPRGRLLRARLDWLAGIYTAPGYGRPLAVQMAALLWLASRAPQQGADDADGLLARILGLERARWQHVVGALDRDRMRDLQRAVAQITLVQRVESGAALERLLQADGYYGDTRAARVTVAPLREQVTLLYGTDAGGAGSLEPDLVGEHHVATLADAELVDGCLDWLDGDDVAAPERPTRQTGLLTVLLRATAPEHGAAAGAGARTRLAEIVRSRTEALAAPLMATATTAPGVLVPLLQAEIPSMGEDALLAIVQAVPGRSVLLDDVALQAAARHADTVRSRTNAMHRRPDALSDDDAGALRRLAASVGTLGIRLGYVDRREDVLAASEEAVRVYRELAASRPDAFLPDLAMSLGAAGRILDALGRGGDAAGSVQDALRLIEPYVERHPDAFGDLARNLGSDLLRYCEGAQVTPDTALLERIARFLGRGGDDTETQALRAKVESIIASAQATGRLDEAALGELPEQLAEQLRAAWQQMRAGESSAAREAEGGDDHGS